MTAKLYADGTSNTYSYLPNGQLQVRTWARGVQTTYSYGPDGALRVVDYDDSTPDITNTVDRLGRVTKVADGIGDCLYFFNTDGSLSSNRMPQVTGGFLSYARDPIGRVTAMVFGDATTPSRSSVAYTFDNAGRLATIGDSMTTATYAYGPDGATWTNLSLGGPLNVTRTFDGLNRLSQISNQPSAASPISFSYFLNQANQRTTNTLADGSFWVYTYDSLGQVISGKKYFAGGTGVGGAQFAYSFDTIGNRASAQEGDAVAGSAAYTANNLNQYSSRNVPGKILITGTASNQAVVSARLGTNAVAQYATKQNTNWFWTSLPADNSGGVFWTNDVRITAYMTQVVAGVTSSLVKTESREVLLAKASEAFTYDLDGNQTADSLWTNVFNGENRLVSMESRSGVPNPAKKKLTFTYDYMGRRTTKKVESAYNGSAYATTNSMTFVWDGWNQIAEVGAGYTNLMTWGLDLSGTLQGAGGVGGLLFESLGGTNCYTIMNGNGDVMGLVSTSGTVVAEMEYSPFGEVIRATGPMAAANHWRFSTKQFDPETGLGYWGYRFYDPETGRWLGRDPMGESGGVGLCLFVQNNTLSFIDPDGRAPQMIGGTWDLTTGRQIDDQTSEYVDYGQANLTLALQGDFALLNANALIAIGVNATWSGVIRKLYDVYDARISMAAEDMVRKGLKTSEGAARWRVDARNQLALNLRANDTEFGRQFANWKKPVDKLKTYEALKLAGKSDASIIGAKPNFRVDKLGRAFRLGGPVLAVGGFILEVHDVACTPEEERLRKIYGVAGSAVGGLSFAGGGARFGAWAGSYVPHPAAPVVGAAVGTILGSVLGAEVGESAGESIYDTYVDE